MALTKVLNFREVTRQVVGITAEAGCIWAGAEGHTHWGGGHVSELQAGNRVL